MKKIIAISALLFSMVITTLNASEVTGESVYKLKCASCHMLNAPKGMMDGNHSKMVNDMKAPPMSKISAKIKGAFDNNESKAIAFVADYIVNPDANKSLCMARAVKAFGLMPPIGKGMSEAEIAVVSKWLVTNFKGTWNVTGKGAKCKSKIDCISKIKCNKADCNKTDCNGTKCDIADCNSTKCDKADCKKIDCNGTKCDTVDCNGTKCDKADCKKIDCNGTKCDTVDCNSTKCDKADCNKTKCGGDKCGKDKNTSTKCASGKCGGAK